MEKEGAGLAEAPALGECTPNIPQRVRWNRTRWDYVSGAIPEIVKVPGSYLLNAFKISNECAKNTDNL